MCVRLYAQKLKHLSSTRSICESAIIVRSSFTNITTSFVYIRREEYDANNIKDQLILARIARWRPSAPVSFQRRSIGEREILISLISFCDFDDVDVKSLRLCRDDAHIEPDSHKLHKHTHTQRKRINAAFSPRTRKIDTYMSTKYEPVLIALLSMIIIQKMKTVE